MPRSEERGGMAARSEAEINSLLVYKSPARQGGVIYCALLYMPLENLSMPISVASATSETRACATSGKGGTGETGRTGSS